jgi:hypothetical protein
VRVPPRLFQPSGHALSCLLVREGAAFFNRLFPASDTFKQRHTTLQGFEGFNIYEVGRGNAVLRNQNRLSIFLKAG